MKVDKVVELFYTMAIVSLNMGDLTMEVNTLKNKLVTGEKEKKVLQDELDKERGFQKGYKHNVEIWRKNMHHNKRCSCKPNGFIGFGVYSLV
jgi:hypothetical protein